MCQLRHSSFGLSREGLLEELFFNVYYGKLTYQDAYNMPVFMRRWWINKVIQEVERKNQAQEDAMNDNK